MESIGKIQIKDKGEIPSRISINDSRLLVNNGEVDITAVGENGQPIYATELALNPCAVLDVSWALYQDRLKSIGIPNKAEFELIFDSDVCEEVREKMLQAMRGFFPWSMTSYMMVRAYRSGASIMEKALEAEKESPAE